MLKQDTLKSKDWVSLCPQSNLVQLHSWLVGLCFLNSYNKNGGKKTAIVSQKCTWSSLKDWPITSINKNLLGLRAFHMSGCYFRASSGTMGTLSFPYSFSRLNWIIFNCKCSLPKHADSLRGFYLDKQKSCEL